MPYWNQCKLFTCHHNLNTHNIVFYIFKCKTLNNFNKLAVIIAVCNRKQTSWPYKQYYLKTSRCFYRKLYKLFFKCRKNWKRANFRRSSFGYNIYIETTKASELIQLYMYYKVYPIRKSFWSAIISYLSQTFNYSVQTQLYYEVCVCVLFHWKLNFSFKIFINCRT